MKRNDDQKRKRPAAQARAKTGARKTSKVKGRPNKSLTPKTSRQKVSAHRSRLRKRGFRLVQMWLPDTRTKEFAEQAHRASLAIANSPSAAADQAFVDSISWWNSPEAAAFENNELPTPWWRTDGKPD